MCLLTTGLEQSFCNMWACIILLIDSSKDALKGRKRLRAVARTEDAYDEWNPSNDDFEKRVVLTICACLAMIYSSTFRYRHNISAFREVEGPLAHSLSSMDSLKCRCYSYTFDLAIARFSMHLT
ncbi:hypothetical protein TNCV_1004221 [Trichonephila clavipes]|nr:hypothetical protein TNCV_1004221 [Trichonephila clavipes]